VPFSHRAARAGTLTLVGCSRTNPIKSASSGPAASAIDLETAPPKTASFKFATRTITVPEGFTVELVAGPPLVNRPISIAF